MSSNPASVAVVAATIIDGNGRGFVLSSESGGNATSILESFTIINGKLEYYGHAFHLGGGVLCDNHSSPTLTNNVIIRNGASGANGYDGSAFCDRHSAPTLTSNAITSN